MNEFKHHSHSDDEMIEVLTAISIVSGRLARNMRFLAAQRKTEEGVNHYEQNRRYGHDHRRAPQCCRCNY